MVRDVLVASLNKGQFPVAIIAAIVVVALWKMPGEEVARLAFEILNRLVDLSVLGWLGCILLALLPKSCFESTGTQPVLLQRFSEQIPSRPAARDPIDRRSPCSSEASGRRSIGWAAGRLCGRAPGGPSHSNTGRFRRFWLRRAVFGATKLEENHIISVGLAGSRSMATKAYDGRGRPNRAGTDQVAGRGAWRTVEIE